jgi:hypothetical protein
MTLSEWRNKRLPLLRNEVFAQSALPVTVLIYHFWPEEQADARFSETEFSILQTWHCCGYLPVSIVCATPCAALLAFAQKYDKVTIWTSPGLIPGSVESMSYDCNGRLAEYFQTNYVLVIQNDGFPLQKGLEAFLGAHNYWGAPLTSKKHWLVLDKFVRCAAGNGGFSLRTRELCLEANRHWKKLERHIRTYYWKRDDIFYCLTLRILSWRYFRLASLPSYHEALRFSYDKLVDTPPPLKLPFGFHGAPSFEILSTLFSAQVIERLNSDF